MAGSAEPAQPSRSAGAGRSALVLAALAVAATAVYASLDDRHAARLPPPDGATDVERSSEGGVDRLAFELDVERSSDVFRRWLEEGALSAAPEQADWSASEIETAGRVMSGRADDCARVAIVWERPVGARLGVVEWEGCGEEGRDDVDGIRERALARPAR